MSALALWPRSLLWRTFILLAALCGDHAAWFAIFRASEIEPRARPDLAEPRQHRQHHPHCPRQFPARAARELLSELAEREASGVHRRARRAPRAAGRQTVLNLALELAREQLGRARASPASARQARLWLSFHIDDDEYWLRIPRERIERDRAALARLGRARAGAVAARRVFPRVAPQPPLRALAQAAAPSAKADTRNRPRVRPEELRTLSHAFNQMSKTSHA